MSRTMLCIARTRIQAEAIVAGLQAAAVPTRDISLLWPEAGNPASERDQVIAEAGTRASVIGGVLGLLAGIGVLPIPGAGPIIAAGPIISALSGAAMGAAVGGIAGALVWIGFPESAARQYEARIRWGGILVSVQCDSCRALERCRKAMAAAHAHDIVQVEEPPLPDFFRLGPALRSD